jgi:hypothetical protein
MSRNSNRMLKPNYIEPDVWATITSAEVGDSAALRHLIEHDRRLARCEYWYTPAIHFAVRGGHLEGVKVLLEADADPEWNGYHCGSLVAMARYRGYEDVAKLLEQARARRGRLAPAEAGPEHPIYAAAKAGDTKRIRELLDTDPALINRGAGCGCSPLHRAVLGGAREAVALLLDRGANIHAFHGTGRGAAEGWWEDVQAIDLAVWGGPPGLGPPRANRRHAEIAKLLLERGAAYNLTIAAARGDLRRVTEILDGKPAAIREAPRNGRRPLSAGRIRARRYRAAAARARPPIRTGQSLARRRAAHCSARRAQATASGSSCCWRTGPIPTAPLIPGAMRPSPRRPRSCARC